ncbi:MAG: GNAT family N-acetyltransferase [Rhodothermales bacterium]|nr:GNAT family N-acetyltransferase [Rhodothermales bacterium]
MTIRPLRPDVHPDWLRMRRALWPACATSMHEREMREYTEPGGERAVLVAEAEDGCPVGFVELSVRDRVEGSYSDRVGYVEGWYVEPAFRGQGVGRRLIEAAERWTAERGLTEIASDAEIENEGSIRAHAALGFRETFRVVQFLKPIRPRPDAGAV